MNDFPPVLAMAFLPVNARLSVETIKVREARVVEVFDTCGAKRRKATFRTLAAGGNNLSAWRNVKAHGECEANLDTDNVSVRRPTDRRHAGSTPAALTILPSAQCSTGTSQSRRHPARPGKVMESAGHQRHGTAALPGEIGSIESPNIGNSRRQRVTL